MFTHLNILQNESSPDSFYVGFTEDLKARLTKHNAGGVTHTAKFRPWRIKTAVAFTDAAQAQARAFEVYLKSPSGRAFAKRRRQAAFARKPKAAAPLALPNRLGA